MSLENVLVVPLKDVVKRVKVGFVGSCNNDYCLSDEGVPMIRTTNLTKEGIKLENLKYINNKFHISHKKSQLNFGDILIARHGHNGLAALWEYKFDAQCLNVVVVEPDESLANKYYLTYLINSPLIQKQIKSLTGGSVQSVVNTKDIADLLIPVPPLEKQKEIADFISYFNKKIKVNKAINKNLLKLSRYLYKEFYMDKVESYDKKEYVTLDDVTSKFATGLNPRKNFVLGEGDNYYVTIKNMVNNSIVLDNKCASITDEALVKINKRSDLRVGDLLFSGIGTIGRVHLIDEKPTNWNISESVFTMRPNELISSEFLFIMLLSQEVQEYAKSLASGSVQKGIRMRDLKAFEFILPIEEDKFHLDSLLNPIIADIKSNEKEIRKLTKLRDTLLPKLMSGEIDVSKINCDI